MKIPHDEKQDPVKQEASFLFVDDDRVSIMALQRTVKKLGIRNQTHVAHDGLEALELLERCARNAGGTLPPFIVTLDMHMPRMNGREFLEAVHIRPALQNLAVLLNSQADIPHDCPDGSFERVNGVIDKNRLRESFAEALDQLTDFNDLITHHVQ